VTTHLGMGGAALIAEAERDFLAAEVENPARYATLWTPGFGTLPHA